MKYKTNKSNNNIKSTISIKGMNNVYKKWKEFARTSPFNMHLAHYKSFLSPDKTESNSPINVFSKTMWHTFISLTHVIINITQKLERWKTIIVIMLEKDKGSPKINRLRVISKYEADYIILLKLYWPKPTTQYVKRKETLGKGNLEHVSTKVQMIPA